MCLDKGKEMWPWEVKLKKPASASLGRVLKCRQESLGFLLKTWIPENNRRHRWFLSKAVWFKFLRLQVLRSPAGGQTCGLMADVTRHLRVHSPVLPWLFTFRRSGASMCPQCLCHQTWLWPTLQTVSCLFLCLKSPPPVLRQSGWC